jgi:AAA family ATP:ADP antiporter
MVGFGVLAFAPSLGTIAVFQVVRRAGDYAIARPTREVLFTVVPREDRYKTKGFIDTFVYRLGDQVGAWSVALLGAWNRQRPHSPRSRLPPFGWSLGCGWAAARKCWRRPRRGPTETTAPDARRAIGRPGSQSAECGGVVGLDFFPHAHVRRILEQPA